MKEKKPENTNEAASAQSALNVRLEDCPFCGGEAAYGTTEYSQKHARDQGWSQTIFHSVNCIICGVNNRGIVGYRSKEAAREKWNRRFSNVKLRGCARFYSRSPA